MLADDGGAPSGNAWWAQPVPDDWLETLLDAAYCGPDAVWPLDETALGGMSAEEQLQLRKQSVLQRLKPTSLQSYKVYLRLWYRWVAHHSLPECQPGEVSLVAHPDSKVDRFLRNVLAEDGPFLSKGNKELYSSVRLMCAALTWLRLLQPGVPNTQGWAQVTKAALHSAGQLRADLYQSSEHDLMAKTTSSTLLDTELDRLLLRCAVHVADGRHWGHKAAFCLLAGRAAGYRADDLCNARYVGLSLSSVETRPTPEMKLLLLYTTTSKANTTGHTEHVVLARHVEPTKCPVGALSRVIVYDMLAYELQLVPLMLRGDSSWRSMHLLWRDPGCIMSSQNYNDIVAPIKQLLDEEGITKSAVGHLGRNTGQAELNRWDFLQDTIRLWGRWFHGAYEQSYLPKSPLRLLSAAAHLAGHNKDTWRTAHFLGRQTIAPPDAWVDVVMPGAREALLLLRQKNSKCSSLHDRDSSAVSCLETLLHLGEVFWQDLVFCDSGVSNLPVVHDIMDSAEFVVFKQQVLQAHNEAQQQGVQSSQQPEGQLANGTQSPTTRQVGRVDVTGCTHHLAHSTVPVVQGSRGQTSSTNTSLDTYQAAHQVDSRPSPAQGGVTWRMLSSVRQLLFVGRGSTRSNCKRHGLVTSNSNSDSNNNIGSSNDNNSPRQLSPVARSPGRPARHRRQAALFEAPPLFSSKLKSPGQGWEEWHGIGTGRPGVKQVLQRIAQDSRIKLGISNSNAKCKRMWLLRAVEAATSVGISEKVAVGMMDTIAAAYEPPLTYLEFLTAVSAVAKHKQSTQPGNIPVVRMLTVADIMQEFRKQHLPLPTTDDSNTLAQLDCRKPSSKIAKVTRKRANEGHEDQHVNRRVTRSRSTRFVCSA